MNYVLIGLCVAVFALQLGQDPRAAQAFIYAFGFTPAVFFDQARLPAEIAQVPASATLVTSMFLHGGLAHLGGNMLYLWIFGDNVEDRLGRFGFIAFYLLCGIAAAFAQGLPDTGSTIPMVGASGAISGVLGAYLLMFPRARVLAVVPFIIPYTLKLPAMVVLGLWFAIQLLSSIGAPEGGGVAFRAHVGGFVAGMVLLPLFLRLRPRRA